MKAIIKAMCNGVFTSNETNMFSGRHAKATFHELLKRFMNCFYALVLVVYVFYDFFISVYAFFLLVYSVGRASGRCGRGLRTH